jgi:hypothetical protein
MNARPTVWELFAEGWRAIWDPARVLRRVPERPVLPYGWLISCLTLWGIPYAFLHFRAMENVWLFQRWPYESEQSVWRLLTFVVGSGEVWLIGVVGLAVAARLMRRAIPLERLEVAAVFLWVLWALMPLADTVHIVFDLPRRYVAVPLPWGGHRSFIAHASWLVAFPAILWLLTAVLRAWFGVRSWWLALGLSAVALVGCRGIIEPMLIVVGEALSGEGAQTNAWKAHVLSEAAGLPLWWGARWWLARPRPVRRGLSSRRLAAAAAHGVLVAIVWLSAAPAVQAATRTWDGGGTPSTLASTATNWSGDTVPGSGDTVVFDGTSDLNCSWDIDLTGYELNSFSVNSGYDGTITLSNDLPITYGFTLASGTFSTGGNSKSVTAETHSQTGGTLTANNSTLTFYTYSKTGGTFTVGGSTVRLTGTGNLTPSTANPAFYNLTCYANSGTHTLQTALNVSNTLTLSACSINTNSDSNHAVSTLHYVQSAGTFTANDSVLTVNGNFTKTGGTFSAGTSLLDFRTSGNANFNPGGAETTYYDVEIIKGTGNAVTLQGDLTVSHQIILSSASSGALSAGAYTITLTGSGTTGAQPFSTNGSADFTAGTSTVVYTGSSTTEIAPLNFYNLTIDKASVQFNFLAGSTTSVSNFLFLRGGGTGSRLTLRSTTGGSQATFNSTGSHLAQYVDVNDLTCGGGHITIHAQGSTLGGNLGANCWLADERIPTGPGPGTPPAY